VQPRLRGLRRPYPPAVEIKLTLPLPRDQLSVPAVRRVLAAKGAVMAQLSESATTGRGPWSKDSAPLV
jgi:hypothetical protein